MKNNNLLQRLSWGVSLLLGLVSCNLSNSTTGQNVTTENPVSNNKSEELLQWPASNIGREGTLENGVEVGEWIYTQQDLPPTKVNWVTYKDSVLHINHPDFLDLSDFEDYQFLGKREKENGNIDLFAIIINDSQKVGLSAKEFLKSSIKSYFINSNIEIFSIHIVEFKTPSRSSYSTLFHIYNKELKQEFFATGFLLPYKGKLFDFSYTFYQKEEIPLYTELMMATINSTEWDNKRIILQNEQVQSSQIFDYKEFLSSED